MVPLYLAAAGVSWALTGDFGARNVFEQRAGLVDSATVVVRNRSSQRSYCPQIEISALDTSGNELEIATAVPVDGNGRLAPNGSVAFRATFTHLTATDYRDKLSKLEGFVIHTNPCG